jgi:beta-xylosidase
MHSRDLINWRHAGAVFSNRPAWSVGNFWAPEIYAERGRYFVFYTARKKDGPLCVAVATASNPAGPYTDRGPLVCQDAGSIDAFPIRDEAGKFYLVWKEDGNSRNEHTPIWAQQLSEDGTKLVGKKKELIRNDAPWEAQLVEAPFIARRDGWFYMFYSGNACCGRECNYAMGVARARNLLGPWEKNPANPILRGNDAWKCPGHGSIVTDSRGRDFLMYHAYHPKDSVYVGRQALLDEVKWGAGGWPVINEGKGPSASAASPASAGERNSEYDFFDDFKSPALMAGWQWPQANRPAVAITPAGGGRLLLSPSAGQKSDPIGAVIARSTTTGDYTAATAINTRGMKARSLAGIAAYGDGENALGLSVGDGKAALWRREKNDHKVVASVDAPNAPVLHLRMTAAGGNRFRFALSPDGRRWTDVGEELDGSFLPPWDRGVRVALTSGGSPQASGAFDYLRITPVR